MDLDQGASRSYTVRKQKLENAGDVLALASLLYEQSRIEEANSKMREAEAEFAEILQPDDIEWLDFLDIALIYSVHNNERGVDELIARVQVIATRHNIKNHDVLKTVALRIINRHWINGEFEKAIAIIEDQIRTEPGQALYDGDLLRPLAMDLIALAKETQDLAKKQELLSRAEQVLRIRKRAMEAELPKGHPDFAWILQIEGDLRRAQGDIARAMSVYEEALKIAEHALSKSNVTSIRIMQDLVDVYVLAKKHDLASELCMHYLQAVGDVYGATSFDLANHFRTIGVIAIHKEDYNWAYIQLAEALNRYYDLLQQQSVFGKTSNQLAEEAQRAVPFYVYATLKLQETDVFKQKSPTFTEPDGREVTLITPSYFGNPISRGFWAAQLATYSTAAQAINMMSARIAKDDSVLSSKIREGQDLIAQRDDLEKQLHSLVGGGAQISVEQTNAVRQKLIELNKKLLTLETGIEKEFPQYNVSGCLPPHFGGVGGMA